MLYSDSPHLEFNASQWRIVIPHKALIGKGHDVAIDHISRIQFHLDSDVFVIERDLISVFFTAIRQLKKKGKRVIATFDDCYDEMPSNLPAYKTWFGNNKHYLNEFHECLGIIDMAIVPSRSLAKYYSKFGRIEVIENYYPDEWLDYPVEEPKCDLGWSGNATHEQSWEDSKLKSAMKEIGRTFILNTSDVGVVNNLHGLFDAHIPWTKHHLYPYIVDKFRVGLAPLAGEYDRYRSNIKIVNYAARGKPWIASDLDPYWGCDGGILVKNTKNGWINAVNEVFNEYDRYSMMARNWASQYRISENINKYEEMVV